jgi:hypothetical protein
MKGKVAFVAGAGLGYLLGTRAGRGQFDKLQAWAEDVWKDPRVQGYVQDFEVQARQFARDQGAVLKDRAVDAAWSAMGQTSKTPVDPDEIVVEDELDPNARRF